MEWKPQRITLIKIKSNNEKLAFKHFRSSSSAYISKKNVISFIMNKYNNKCNYCGNYNNLEIDHIKSVHQCFNLKEFNFCNSLENLQVLCKKCNTSKKP